MIDKNVQFRDILTLAHVCGQSRRVSKTFFMTHLQPLICTRWDPCEKYEVNWASWAEIHFQLCCNSKNWYLLFQMSSLMLDEMISILSLMNIQRSRQRLNWILCLTWWARMRETLKWNNDMMMCESQLLFIVKKSLKFLFSISTRMAYVNLICLCCLNYGLWMNRFKTSERWYRNKRIHLHNHHHRQIRISTRLSPMTMIGRRKIWVQVESHWRVQRTIILRKMCNVWKSLLLPRHQNNS